MNLSNVEGDSDDESEPQVAEQQRVIVVAIRVEALRICVPDAYYPSSSRLTWVKPRPTPRCLVRHEKTSAPSRCGFVY